MKQCDLPTFLKDVKNHQMTVLRDEGAYRHVKFENAPPHRWNLWFEIVTWPHALVLRGDMGTWTFSRIEDMFAFFRSRKEMYINPHYWEEKCEAHDRRVGPPRKFDADAFAAAVIESLEGYGLEPKRKKQIVKALREDVFCLEHEYPMREALANFEHGGFSLSDPWEIDGRTYGYHYIWCLFAIVWGIQQYDAWKAAEAVPERAEALR